MRIVLTNSSSGDLRDRTHGSARVATRRLPDVAAERGAQRARRAVAHAARDLGHAGIRVTHTERSGPVAGCALQARLQGSLVRLDGLIEELSVAPVG